MLTAVHRGLALLFAGWLAPAALSLRCRADLADPRVSRSRAGPASALVTYLEVLILVGAVSSFRSDERAFIKLCVVGAVPGPLLVGEPRRALAPEREREAPPRAESRASRGSVSTSEEGGA